MRMETDPVFETLCFRIPDDRQCPAPQWFGYYAIRQNFFELCTFIPKRWDCRPVCCSSKFLRFCYIVCFTMYLEIFSNVHQNILIYKTRPIRSSSSSQDEVYFVAGALQRRHIHSEGSFLIPWTPFLKNMQHENINRALVSHNWCQISTMAV
jgi:hypothetical protein